jgi:hypothetical protein
MNFLLFFEIKNYGYMIIPLVRDSGTSLHNFRSHINIYSSCYILQKYKYIILFKKFF